MHVCTALGRDHAAAGQFVRPVKHNRGNRDELPMLQTFLMRQLCSALMILLIMFSRIGLCAGIHAGVSASHSEVRGFELIWHSYPYAEVMAEDPVF